MRRCTGHWTLVFNPLLAGNCSIKGTVTQKIYNYSRLDPRKSGRHTKSNSNIYSVIQRIQAMSAMRLFLIMPYTSRIEFMCPEVKDVKILIKVLSYSFDVCMYLFLLQN